MLASARRNHLKRRGIVLVLVLAVLGMMAVIGFTFATFTGQSRTSARSFAQSVNQPQRDELMDYALAQLISDTADIRSAIRGHSLARDMYGDDAFRNGYLTSRPDGAYMGPNNDPFFYITAVASAGGTLYNLTTNIPVNDPAFYGYDFTRWTLRVSYGGVLNNGGTGVVDQSFEVLADSSAGQFRVFTVNINPSDTSPTLINPTVTPSFPTGYVTQLPGQYVVNGSGLPYRFILDGRWLHAFNGAGMTANAVYGNFKFNQPFVAGPNAVGMDEDYDAVDLENWFLAMQSADGSVMIPSFHRPAAIRLDAANGIWDWGGPNNFNQANWAESAARILRPRLSDGHDRTTFPDLTPDASGHITYDVDNDGDGQTDSVWVDLGYPARRSAQGQLYKPLFAFMVIGVNGRIPLNTAGNLAGGAGGGGGSSHAAHLGNSPSEVDPTYGLQNGFVLAADVPGAFTAPVYDPVSGNITSACLNGQVDSGGIDVRLTQIRNLLAGTRPQPNPSPSGATGFPQLATGSPMLIDQNGTTNGDDNFVAYSNGRVYYMPNGIAENAPVDIPVATGPNQVQRITPPVAGRWGEAQSVPGNPTINPNTGLPFNLVGAAYNNRVRAGFSEDPGDLMNGLARDAADDNYNSFDPYPPLGARLGEVNDLDFLDLAGAFLLPVERMRRYVTPADINGTGRILAYDGVNARPGPNLGADQWGRVEYSSYFRPPGLPGVVPPTVLPGPGPFTTGITFPWAAGNAYPTTIITDVTTGRLAGTLLNDNNPLHGFESQRFPNLNYNPPGFNPQRAGGVPIDIPANANPNYAYLPGKLPTYDASVNGNVRSDGLNEADEMNLYRPNVQLDSPFGFSDLEWLYRLQDIDGTSLSSRLSQLAPISFTNTVDGQRRRRLFSLDGWDLINYAWTNDNPGGVAFAYNSRYTAAADAGFTTLNVPAATNPNIAGLPNPTLAAPSPAFSVAQRDKKINLNYPLPVSNDPNEAVRQKWISDTYQTLKAILPPRSVDTPEELAQLSQFVINIIDFRDTDATMTHWQNPDVWLRVGNNGTNTAPYLVLTANRNTTTDIPVDQYGMEYCPIAINEVLAYSFQRKATVGGNPAVVRTPRFFAELVNTLNSPELGTTTAPGLGTGANNASVLDLAGFQSGSTPAPITPWDGGCWDIVFTDDGPQDRPDPIRGQLQPTGRFYGLIPLVSATFNNTPTVVPTTPPGPPQGNGPPPPPTAGADPVIYPLPQTAGAGATVGNPVTSDNFFTGVSAAPSTYPVAPNYFLTIGNPLQPSVAGAKTEQTPFGPTYELNLGWDPVDYVDNTNPGNGSQLPAAGGVLPPTTVGGTEPTRYPVLIPSTVPTSAGAAQFYWMCLRRPANPFAPVTDANPMIVVDCMRFPYIEGQGTGTIGAPDTVTKGNNKLYSYQRLQPFRGGQAVPMPGAAGQLDPRYGYTEQVAQPVTDSGNYGNFGNTAMPSPQITQDFFHTLGKPNDANGTSFGTINTPATPTGLSEPWDYFAFNDRDFTSVAELMLVPGYPPGLFTKQFAEFAPSQSNVTTVFSTVTPLTTPLVGLTGPAPPASATTTFVTPGSAAEVPHSFPYLVDKFFYTAASPGSAIGSYFGDATGDGWFKMFEFFEVPSQMIGAVGPVAQGMNFDWARQDAKPGLININLMIDEEVFFSVFGRQDAAFNQQLLSFDQLPISGFTGGPWTGPLVSGASPIPLVVTATLANGAPAAAYPMNNVGVVALDPLTNVLGNRMKASFAQFLSLRHGGSGFIYGYGSGGVGQNFAVQAPTPYPNGPGVPPAIPSDRPFHSLSYPDINYTLMRPAALPPSAFTDPKLPTPAPVPQPPGSVPYPPTGYTGGYVGDPGVRNLNLYQGFTPASTATPVGSTPSSNPTTQVLVPPAIPARRLFQPPDFSDAVSNAGESGDPYLNRLTPVTVPNNPAPGALPPFTVVGNPLPVNVNDGKVSLVWTAGTLPPGVGSPYLGANSVAGPPIQYDMTQHPYFRTELLQKAMNLTTVRTHQYAVWITIGFFEVTRQGDLGMFSVNPQLAFDILGPELGATTGQTTRFRAFFLVDRLKLFKFDPNTPDSFRPAVVYRQVIE
jgi:hypothetical protein